ncbi:helix-turn-helix domain-containing protein [Tissierella carlieri]|uniref:helix-turn-helix domain-containing protein n=1 Tax=Tissierella carlieri TaxID=689904 RepID=UPI001C0F6089|nr:helix-turn-helix domain-containing protein [Tissierella carlieri]MBU5312315.1 helix-turn-helix domain-containing protein [Tissierella carlieri]
MNNKYLMSIVEASKHFNIGRDKLYALVRSQEDIPIIRIGETTKINVPLFEEWLNRATLEGREL